jgi:hypothetical protein
LDRNSPDVSNIVKRNTLLAVVVVIVAVPDAPAGDANVTKVPGEQAGAAELMTPDVEELPVNVTRILASDGKLDAGVNVTVMNNPDAPAVTLDIEIAGDAAPMDPFKMDGNVPATDVPRTTPVLLLTAAATLNDASCGRAGTETVPNENEISELAAKLPVKKVTVSTSLTIFATPIALAGETKLTVVPFLQLSDPESVMTTLESDDSAALGVRLTVIVTPVYPAAMALNAIVGAFSALSLFKIAGKVARKLEI